MAGPLTWPLMINLLAKKWAQVSACGQSLWKHRLNVYGICSSVKGRSVFIFLCFSRIYYFYCCFLSLKIMEMPIPIYVGQLVRFGFRIFAPVIIRTLVSCFTYYPVSLRSCRARWFIYSSYWWQRYLFQEGVWDIFACGAHYSCFSCLLIVGFISRRKSGGPARPKRV